MSARRVARAVLAAAAASATASGCARAPTEVVVVVDTNLPVPAAIDRVEVQVTGRAAAEAQSFTARLHGPGAVALPATLVLYPRGEWLGPFRVSAVGLLGDRAVVRREARASFVPNERRTLPVPLWSACASASACPPEQTCGEGGVCEPAAAEDLPAWTGAPPRIDATPGAERLAPTGVVYAENLDTSAGVTALQNRPDAPDGRWFTRIDPAARTVLVVSFPTPVAPPRPGRIQEFRVRVRSHGPAGGAAPLCLVLRETERPSQEIIDNDFNGCMPTSSSAGEVVAALADVTALADRSARGVHLAIASDARTSPQARAAEIEAVEWVVRY